MSKVAIIGATGNAGSRLLEEALRRGHMVTALARDTSTLEAREGLGTRNVDATDTAALADAIAGHDAVFSATRFASVPESAIVGAVKRAGVARLMVVGGAGSLYVAPGRRVLDAPGFPPAYREEATAGAAFLDALRRERDVLWTFVSPSAEFVSGPRTRRFRLGVDELLVDGSGRSWISFDDFAIAFLDAFERGESVRQRFTVGY
ncbi:MULTISPECIES: NAD(P)H-binding protein [unclassified Caballeronia]|uniref:NAD(P)-dependent oxidoreductase n=1 Tax=unclassified Caballeronia TaxID=2646786 RepID=UPI00285E9CB6|nr:MULTISPECIES: NAD(P)H-binding protein [unclassified Caballeronia]MDR5739340.1 NAD(P)H-binding protein [Caballeronia sp. LZ016]MDR5807829.1 NAD(P)H-binding protein [Caballeronia sp. LZ019]